MKIVLSLSGGMDSATLLARALEQGHDPLCVSFIYPSRHNIWERAAAHSISNHYGVKWQEVDVTPVFASFKSSLLLGQGKLPEGHYEAESMKQTVVPARNLIFASILTGLSISENATEIWLGMHAGDHAIYPDCRPGFVRDLLWSIQDVSECRLFLQTPFLYMTKTQILSQGLRYNPPVPYNLTRTCYSSDEIACGRCGACQERLESFSLCGVEDPLEYVSREIMPREVKS